MSICTCSKGGNSPAHGAISIYFQFLASFAYRIAQIVSNNRDRIGGDRNLLRSAEESIVLPPSIDDPGNYDGFRILLYPIKHQIAASSGFAILLAQWAQGAINSVGIGELSGRMCRFSEGFHQLFRRLRRTKMLRKIIMLKVKSHLPHRSKWLFYFVFCSIRRYGIMSLKIFPQTSKLFPPVLRIYSQRGKEGGPL